MLRGVLFDLFLTIPITNRSQDLASKLLDLHEFGQNSVVQSANSIVFIEEAPAHYGALINHEYCWLSNLAVRIIKGISIYDLMIGVGKNRKRELQLVGELATLVQIVDADGYNLGAGSGKLLVVCGQTGQLLSAIRSPVAAIEH